MTQQVRCPIRKVKNMLLFLHCLTTAIFPIDFISLLLLLFDSGACQKLTLIPSIYFKISDPDNVTGDSRCLFFIKTKMLKSKSVASFMKTTMTNKTQFSTMIPLVRVCNKLTCGARKLSI